MFPYCLDLCNNYTAKLHRQFSCSDASKYFTKWELSDCWDLKRLPHSFMAWKAQLAFFYGTQSVRKTYLNVSDNSCCSGKAEHWLRTGKALKLKSLQAVKSLPWASDPNWILSLLNVKPAISTGCITEMGSRCAFSFKEFTACRSLLVKFHTALHILTNSSFATLASKKLIYILTYTSDFIPAQGPYNWTVYYV